MNKLHDNRVKNRTLRRSGVTLLITLLVLVVLSSVMVQFQSDTSLHLRSSEHSISRLKCRYAAESGIVTGGKLVKIAMENARDAYRKTREKSKHPELFDDKIAETELPPEQQVLADMLAQQGGDRPSFVVEAQELKIGDVDVIIEVHDENAKLPLLWLLRSPFGGRGSNFPKESLEHLGEAIGVDDDLVNDIFGVIGRLKSGVNLPHGATLQLSKDADKYKMKKKRRRHMSLSRKRKDAAKLRESMGGFANQWYVELSQDDDLSGLGDELETVSGTFGEYLGPWGHGKINLNTAPKEVLAAAFGDIGLNEAMLDTIITHRSEQPFTNTNELRDIGIPLDLTKILNELCSVLSDTYSVHVYVELGPTHSRLTSGMYHYYSRLNIMGIVSGG